MNNDPSKQDEGLSVALPGPVINPAFAQHLDRLVALAKQGQSTGSPLFNPSEQWLIDNIRVFQDLPADERDGLMREWDRIFPQYQLARNKGYPTPAHKAMLREHGPTPLHRRSYAPVSAAAAAHADAQPGPFALRPE